MTNKEKILALLQKRPLVLDGAMGTELYQLGIDLKSSFDEQNLKNPELVKKIHENYLTAGADIIRANTYGANSITLGRFGLADQLAPINLAGVSIAKEAASEYVKKGSDIFIAASVGPCLKPNSVWSLDLEQNIVAAVSKQVEVLLVAGVDIIFLETFSHISEVTCVINTIGAKIKEKSIDTLLIAGCTVDDKGFTAVGDNIESFITRFNESDFVDMILFNCGLGPNSFYTILKKHIQKIQKPVFLAPNAGAPREVDGRMLYLNNPSYFGRYARRFITLGVAGVGGCCGTNEQHIEAIVKEFRSLEKQEFLNITSHGNKNKVAIENKKPVAPLTDKSYLAKKLYTKINTNDKKIISLELVPPRGFALTKTLAKAKEAKEAGIDFINLPDGPRASARLSSFITALEIQNKVGIETILHYTCRDRNLLGIQSDLLGAQAMGIKNILAVTGDPPKLGDYPDAKGVFDIDAIGLIKTINNLNNGYGLGGDDLDPTSIFIGAALDPTANFLDVELDRLVKKQDAGAEFVITQPLFDAQELIKFLKRSNCKLPILAGIWPLYSYKNAEFLNFEVPGINIPDEVMLAMSKCKTKEEGIAMGIALAKDICKEIAPFVAGFQISVPYSRVDIAVQTIDDFL